MRDYHSKKYIQWNNQLTSGHCFETESKAHKDSHDPTCVLGVQFFHKN